MGVFKALEYLGFDSNVFISAVMLFSFVQGLGSLHALGREKSGIDGNGHVDYMVLKKPTQN